MNKIRYLLAAGVTTVVTCALVPAVSGASADPSAPVVVVSGLNNPRQLSLVGGNDLLIAEAGSGGPTVVNSDQGPEFVGYTGSVSEVLDPASAEGTSPNRVVTGTALRSRIAGRAVRLRLRRRLQPRANSAIYLAMTYAPPDALPTPPTSPQVGRLLRAKRDGSFRSIANITKYERLNDPDGHGFDSNPYAVLALPDGSELVADAAGNDVLRVSSSGISVFHVFPNVTGGYKCSRIFDPTPNFPGCNYVPTSLARDAAGHIYVGGLSSLVKHRGAVTELSADGSTVLNYWSGFSGVSGVAVGSDGSLYVSSLFGREAAPIAPMVVGVITKVAPNGHRTNMDVPFPAGIAVDGADNVYVSAFSVAPSAGIAGPGTDGQVWRVHF